MVIAGIGIALSSGVRSLGELWGFVAIMGGVAGAFAGGLLALDVVGPWYVRVRARRLHRKAGDVPRLLAARMILEDPKGAWRQVAGVSVTTFVGVVAGSAFALASLAGPDSTLSDDIRAGVLVTLVASFVMVACTVAINQAAATRATASHTTGSQYQVSHTADPSAAPPKCSSPTSGAASA